MRHISQLLVDLFVLDFNWWWLCLISKMGKSFRASIVVLLIMLIILLISESNRGFFVAVFLFLFVPGL
jgi:hypothetical protein